LQNQSNFMIKLSFPFTEEKIRALKVGDEVLISGVVFTGRDAAGLASYPQ
jgi:fumarate hydratase subunit beta